MLQVFRTLDMATGADRILEVGVMLVTLAYAYIVTMHLWCRFLNIE